MAGPSSLLQAERPAKRSGNRRAFGLSRPRKPRAKAVLDAVRTGLLVLDEQGRVAGLNPAMAAMLSARPAAPDYQSGPAGPEGPARPEGQDGRDMAGRTVLEATGSAELQRLVDAAVAGGAGPPDASGPSGVLGPERPAGQPAPDDGSGPRGLPAAAGPAGESGTAGQLVELPGGGTFEVVVAPVLRTGRPAGWVAEFREAGRLARLLQIRRDFVANAAHELKTPLTSIRGYAETLLDGEGIDPATGRRFLAAIVRNADQMIRMVHGMLELSRLESEPRPEPVPVDAGAALAQAVQALAREAEARGVRIEGDLAGVPAVLATPDGLVQVFRNLLENGVRFSPAGGVVRVAAVRQGRDVAFSVSDQGPGIPPDRLERVFERFYTIGGAGAGGAGSTGLGLAICRHIVRGLGGEIRAYSPAGSAPGRSQTLATGPGQAAGAAFVFTLRAADRSG